MENHFENPHNKSIEWEYLPDEQLINVVFKYPFYTMSNVEIFKRITSNNNPVFNHLKDRIILYLPDHKLFTYNYTSKNKIVNRDEKKLKTNELESYSLTPDRMEMPDISNITEPLIPVEPLHTVDYFLSQGIRITEDPVSTDKLGAQLKSFTDWLKSMKKVHPLKPGFEGENTDKIIQTIAETSNAATDVETEAMAEVLISQGKRLQALEIYQKLSLKNPSESAYFAAKIQSLKQA